MLTREDLKAIKGLIESGNKDLWTKILKEFDDEVEPIKREVHVMKKEVDEIADESGKNDKFLRRRMKKIEDHLELPPRKG